MVWLRQKNGFEMENGMKARRPLFFFLHDISLFAVAEPKSLQI